MAGVELSRRVKVVAYTPLIDMDAQQRREFQVALLEAQAFEDLAGKWQAAIQTGPSRGPARSRFALIEWSLMPGGLSEAAGPLATGL